MAITSAVLGAGSLGMGVGGALGSKGSKPKTMVTQMDPRSSVIGGLFGQELGPIFGGIGFHNAGARPGQIGGASGGTEMLHNALQDFMNVDQSFEGNPFGVDEQFMQDLFLESFGGIGELTDIARQGARTGFRTSAQPFYDKALRMFNRGGPPQHC